MNKEENEGMTHWQRLTLTVHAREAVGRVLRIDCSLSIDLTNEVIHCNGQASPSLFDVATDFDAQEMKNSKIGAQRRRNE